MGMEVNNQGSGNVQNNKEASNVEKAEDLKFKKLHLGNIFSIADDGDGKVGITDIHGKRSQYVIQLLLPYIEKGAQWTQEIVDNISSAIKQLDKKSIEQETELTETDGWVVAEQDKNGKKFINKDGRVATEHYATEGVLTEYNNGETYFNISGKSIKVTDVKYDEQNNHVTQWTDENGVTTNNEVLEDGTSVRTFTKDGQPTTTSAQLPETRMWQRQVIQDNISSIEYDSNGKLKSYIIANGKFENAEVTNMHYDDNGKLLSFINSDGNLVDNIQYGCDGYCYAIHDNIKNTTELMLLDNYKNMFFDNIKTAQCIRDNDNSQQSRIFITYQSGNTRVTGFPDNFSPELYDIHNDYETDFLNCTISRSTFSEELIKGQGKINNLISYDKDSQGNLISYVTQEDIPSFGKTQLWYGANGELITLGLGDSSEPYISDVQKCDNKTSYVVSTKNGVSSRIDVYKDGTYNVEQMNK